MAPPLLLRERAPEQSRSTVVMPVVASAPAPSKSQVATPSPKVEAPVPVTPRSPAEEIVRGPLVTVETVSAAPVVVMLLVPVESMDSVVASRVVAPPVTLSVTLAEPSATVRVPPVAMLMFWLTASSPMLMTPALLLMDSAPLPSMSMVPVPVEDRLPEPS